MNPTSSSPNDFKVVSFHNSESYRFAPEMGCMFDSVTINGNQGGPGIMAGETVVLPYHIAHLLARNLAKYSMTISSGITTQVDAEGKPIVKSMWNDVELESKKNSYLTELYSEEKPVKMSETDILMARVAEYMKLTDEKIASLQGGTAIKEAEPTEDADGMTYKDKAEVIAELDKRGIKHSKRDSKDTLEKLLA